MKNRIKIVLLFFLFIFFVVAVECRAGVWTDLGTLPGDLRSFAFDINDSGHIVGQSEGASSTRAFLWHAGTMTDLSTIVGGTNSFAYGINNSGQIVGATWSSTSGYQGFVYQNGVATTIDPLLPGLGL